MIRQADKGGAFAVWRTDLYIAEVQRQLADQRFYKKISSDVTPTSQQEVKTFNQLPAWTMNLIAEHLRTSKFYWLPKIHKPVILDSFRFRDSNGQRLIFTMDI